jgi:hypothetical protein
MNKVLAAAFFVMSVASSCGGPVSNIDAGVFDSELPLVTSDAEITAWINKGFYKSWKCETASHAARSPSPHGNNRICSNAKLSGHTTGEYPIGAVAAKELTDASGTVNGYALAVKKKAGAGEAWYWYEIMGTMVVASGYGDTGSAKTVCVGCHMGAGSDAMHSGHDFVYTQIK